MRKETRCRHIGYSFRLTARVLLYAPSHRQDNTYHGLCYTSRGALAGTRNSSMGPPHEGSIRRPIAPWANALPLSYVPLPFVRCSIHGWWPTCFKVRGIGVTGLDNTTMNSLHNDIIKWKTHGVNHCSSSACFFSRSAVHWTAQMDNVLRTLMRIKSYMRLHGKGGSSRLTWQYTHI